ncbi:MAG: hypothetical protein IIB43_01090 [Candidatus Marinimicrobia bacterium]|nr:hypothetical protein [Candidatus Neomarinimicrobiota bacterium]
MNSDQNDQRQVGTGRAESGISRWWHSLPNELVSVILDWGVVLAVVVLVVVIYVPKAIWAEEDRARDESRRRMTIIQAAEDFYRTISDSYTTDGPFLFKLISQTHDSLVGDTTFIGEQIVYVDGSPYTVDIPEILLIQMDTTFTVSRTVRDTMLDTTYAVALWNEERSVEDTVYINGSRGLGMLLDTPAYLRTTDTSYGSHTELINDYAWFRYRLTEDLLKNPVSGLPYEIKLDSTGTVLTIAFPESDLNEQRRYLFFKFKALDHGEIVDSKPSWRSGE